MLPALDICNYIYMYIYIQHYVYCIVSYRNNRYITLQHCQSLNLCLKFQNLVHYLITFMSIYRNIVNQLELRRHVQRKDATGYS